MVDHEYEPHDQAFHSKMAPELRLVNNGSSQAPEMAIFLSCVNIYEYCDCE